MPLNPKAIQGRKKPQFHHIPANALIHLGAVMKAGADKYGIYNWQQIPIEMTDYHDAILRHLLAIQMGEWFDRDDGRPHAAHIMACAAIIIDAKENGTLKWLICKSPQEILDELSAQRETEALSE